MDIVYFELNHWSTEYYPDEEPFESWMSDYYETPEEKAKSWIQEPKIMDKWYKDNGLCVVVSIIDMSVNFCITAPRAWVEEHCPRLLTDYPQFLRTPDEDGEVIGYFDGHFVEWSEENCGIWYDIDDEDGYKLEKWEEDNANS
jgi:hypothetical protein